MSEMPTSSRSVQTPGDCVSVRSEITLADLEIFRKQSQRRHDSTQGSGDDTFLVMYLVGGFAVAAGLIVYLIGAVADIRNPTVPLLCGVTFYLGRYIETWMVGRRRLAAWHRALAPLLETPYTVTVDTNGVEMSSARHRQWSSWSNIRETTSSGKLIVFWLQESGGLVLPRRAISEAEASRVFEFARQPVVPKKV